LCSHSCIACIIAVRHDKSGHKSGHNTVLKNNT
jgi:hypothetical protein